MPLNDDLDWDDDDEPPSRWKKLWAHMLRLKWLWISLVILGLLGQFVARPAWRRYRETKAIALIEESTRLALEGDVGASAERLKRAQSLFYLSEPIQRVLAKHYTTLNDARALKLYQSLAGLGHAREEDFVQLVEQSIRWRETASAESVVDKRLKDPATQASAPWSALCIRWLMAEGRKGEAEAFLAKVKQIQGADTPEILLAESRIALESLTAASAEVTRPVQLAIDSLCGLLRSQKPNSTIHRESALLFAQRLLAIQLLRRVVTPEQAGLLAEALDKETASENPNDADEARLAAAGIRILSKPEEKATIIKELQAFFEKQGVHRQVSLARWLTRYGMFEAAVAWNTRKPGLLAIGGWYLSHLDALAGLQRWDDVDRLLADAVRPPDVSKTIAALFAVRSGYAQKLAEDSIKGRINTLMQAVDGAAPQDVFYAAWNLENTGNRALAITLFEKLSKSELMAPVGLRGLIRYYSGDPAKTDELLSVLERLAELQPEAREVKNDLAYISMLAGKNVENSITTARNLAKEAPQFLAFRTTAALAELKADKPAEALKLYDGLQVTPEWPAPFKAVYAAVLAKNGQQTKAEALASGITMDQLRPAEVQFLKQTIGSK